MDDVTDTHRVMLRSLAQPGTPVLPEIREGIFLHTFKCGECELEWEIRSWLRDRHTLATVWCPECLAAPDVHWVLQVSEATEMSLDANAVEIFRLVRGEIVEHD